MVSPKKLTPAMEQVKTFKEKYPDCILFMRMGDFYETFFEDAEICARELDIVQTSRSKDPDGNPIPLAGIPYHAVDLYLPRMIRKGYKVAVCEQIEDPKLAKGVVKRDVVRVVTPGTAIDADVIPGSTAHYLMALCPDAKKTPKKYNIITYNAWENDDCPEAIVPLICSFNQLAISDPEKKKN